MIRYYGFLANCLRGKLLPLVHEYLGLVQIHNTDMTQTTYAQLMMKDFGIDPFTCPLCGFDLILEYMRFENFKTYKMFHLASVPQLKQLSMIHQIARSKNSS